MYNAHNIQTYYVHVSTTFLEVYECKIKNDKTKFIIILFYLLKTFGINQVNEVQSDLTQVSSVYTFMRHWW